MLRMLPAVMLLATVAGAAETKPLEVAVVNITRVFDAYKKTQKVNELMKEKFGGRRQELEERQRRIAEKEAALRADTRSPDDPALLKERQDLNYQKLLLERDSRKLMQEMAEFNLKHTAEIMAEIEAAVRRYAQAKHIDLVLKYQPPQQKARTNLELTQQIGANPVLYFRNTLDITDAIITLLNEAYDRGISLVPRGTN